VDVRRPLRACVVAGLPAGMAVMLGVVTAADAAFPGTNGRRLLFVHETGPAIMRADGSHGVGLPYLTWGPTGCPSVPTGGISSAARPGEARLTSSPRESIATSGAWEAR
jgi:hypothetical protein